MLERRKQEIRYKYAVKGKGHKRDEKERVTEC
jgi:hypothetical protein